MNRHVLFLVLMSAVFALTLGNPNAAMAEDHSHGHDVDGSDKSKTARVHNMDNPLIEEMIALDRVFRDVVSAVALGDAKTVHHALHHMHGMMEKTHEGVGKGTVKLAKNAHRLNDFVVLDKEFHERLEALAESAHKNDQPAMLTITKDLLDRCVGCHRDFK